MKLLLSLAFSALALVNLVLGQVATRTDYPPGINEISSATPWT